MPVLRLARAVANQLIQRIPASPSSTVPINDPDDEGGDTVS